MTLDASNSHAKMQAAKAAESPFAQTEDGGRVVDDQKLIRMWAVNAEAMQAVGQGFESVVGSINVLLQDNKRTRAEARSAKSWVMYGLIVNIISGISVLYGIMRVTEASIGEIRALVDVTVGSLQ